MSYEFYKVLHLLGMALVVMSLGGLLVHVINGGSKESNSWRKGAMMTHGIGLLLLLVAGFGMLAKLQIPGLPAWAAAKLVIWLMLGGLVAVIYKKPALATKLWVVVPGLALIATVLGIYHGAM